MAGNLFSTKWNSTTTFNICAKNKNVPSGIRQSGILLHVVEPTGLSFETIKFLVFLRYVYSCAVNGIVAIAVKI
jgi:hypothetical protein